MIATNTKQKPKSSKAKTTTRKKTVSSIRAKSAGASRSRRSTAAGAKSPGKPRTKAPESILAELGIIGYDDCEPAILASLVTGDPLLLIGSHGTGKSYLLTRIAEALGLEWRHYNASLLNYDDLVGYPLPDANGQLNFVRTPASIWEAEAVFFDEIARCRPDLQNKLFPIIHERRVQGILLECLKYRWGAINPPQGEDDEDDAVSYRGCEPLDTALADRFAFIVKTPDWSDLNQKQRNALVLRADEPLRPEAGERLAWIVSSARDRLPLLVGDLADPLSRYVCHVIELLRQAGIDCSPRRAAIIHRNISAVHAVRLELEAEPEPGQSALIALRDSLPHPAEGIRIKATKVLAAHKEAWQAFGYPDDDPRITVYLEKDLCQRALRASRVTSLSSAEYSSIIADCLAGLPIGARHALSAELFESGAAGRLVAAVAEQCGELYGFVATPQEFRDTVIARSTVHEVWKHVCSTLARTDADGSDGNLLENLLVGLFARNELQCKEDVDEVTSVWTQARAKINGGRK